MERTQLLTKLEGLARRRAPERVASNGGDPGHDRHEPEAATAKIAELETAVERRTVLGQASGIVMERFGLSAEDAWGVLVKLSQNSNRKVYEIARELVETREIEGL
jgi:hypothetical protein